MMKIGLQANENHYRFFFYGYVDPKRMIFLLKEHGNNDYLQYHTPYTIFSILSVLK